jgi:hypothetical protein
VVPVVSAVVPVVVPVVSAVVPVVPVVVPVVPVVDAAVLGVHVTPGPLSIVPVVDCAYAGAIASAAKATVERRSFLMFRSSGFEFVFKAAFGERLAIRRPLGQRR